MKIKNSIKILLLVVILAVSSCSEDDNAQVTDERDLGLVTGLDLRSDQFAAPIRLGNPNTFINSSIAYPNPAINVLRIDFNTNENVLSIFLLEASKAQIFQDIDFDSIFNSNTYSREQISDNSIEEFEINNGVDNIVLNLEGYSEGYYRVFIQTDNGFHWHNFYKGAPDIEDLIDDWDD